MRSLIVVACLLAASCSAAEDPGATAAPTLEVREVIAVYGDLDSARPDGRAWSSGYRAFDRYPSATPGAARCAFVLTGGRCSFAADVAHADGDIVAREDASSDAPRAVFHLGPPIVTLTDVVAVATKPFAHGVALSLNLTPAACARNRELTTRVKARGDAGTGPGTVAFLIDGVVVADPTVIEPSADDIVVHGRLTADEIQRLDAAIRARDAVSR